MGRAPLAARLLRTWRWKRASIVDQEADLLNSGVMHTIQNFSYPDVLSSGVGPDVDLFLGALADAFPNFIGQLIGSYSIASEEDLVVTSYGDSHCVFTIRVSHGNGMQDARQIDGTVTRRRGLQEGAQQEQCGKDHGHLNKGSPIDPTDQFDSVDASGA